MHDYASSALASARNSACVRQIHLVRPQQVAEGRSSANFLVEQFIPVGGVMIGTVEIGNFRVTEPTGAQELPALHLSACNYPITKW